jgi:flagellar biosynthesis chaperone FliJ
MTELEKAVAELAKTKAELEVTKALAAMSDAEKEFVAKENRKEQMFLDEIATQKFVRAHQTKSGEE